MNEKEIQPLAFSLKELSRNLGVSVSFLRLEIGRGKLRPTYLGRRVVVTRGAVDEYLNRSMQNAQKRKTQPGEIHESQNS